MATAETTAAVNTVLKFGDEYDVRRLKWKMSPDEVCANEELTLNDEGTKEIFGNDVNVLSSDDAEIFGYKAKMQLCFYPENIGLAEVLYTIQTDDLAGLYEELFDKAVEEFGNTDDEIKDILNSVCRIDPDKEYTIMLSFETDDGKQYLHYKNF